MRTREIIDRAMGMAGAFAAKETREVKLPVFAYEDWLTVYQKADSGAAQGEFRDFSRQNWYLVQYLKAKGIRALPVPVRPGEFKAWAIETAHQTGSGHDMAHAVGEYVNRPEARVSPCRHAEFLTGLSGRVPCLATITVFGERPEEPEVMSVVLHGSDGSVLESLEILANDFSPQQAWEKVMAYLDEKNPMRVFQDKEIRKPQFCSDCNALLVNVASPRDIDQALADI